MWMAVCGIAGLGGGWNKGGCVIWVVVGWVFLVASCIRGYLGLLEISAGGSALGLVAVGCNGLHLRESKGE